MAKSKKSNGMLVGVIAAICAIAVFVLLMSCSSVVAKIEIAGHVSKASVSGIEGIFGNSDSGLGATWAGIVAWVLALVAVLSTVCSVVLSVLKKTKLVKLLAVVSALCLVVAGVMMFCEVAAFKAVNGDFSFGGSYASIKYLLGTGWIIGGIVSVLGGVVAICPVVVK